MRAEPPLAYQLYALPPRPEDVRAEDVLDRFLQYVKEREVELYPAQEEAILEIIAGKNVTQLNRRGVARLRQRIGLVFQDIKFLVDMTVLDNVALAALVAGAPRRASYRKAQGLLGEFGLAEKVHAGPLALSRGEQQRVAIARALMNDPFLVLADEPTGNLDAEHAEKTMEIFLKIRQGGTTLMIASHNLALGQRYGTRIISLQHGCLIDDWERVSR